MESSGWDLDIAIGQFYEADDNMEVEDFDAVRSQATPAAPAAAKPKDESPPTKSSTGAGTNAYNIFLLKWFR